MRPLDAGEKSFWDRVQTLVAAFPPAPKGWRISDESIGRPTEVCKDDAAQGRRLHAWVSRTYDHVDGLEAQQAKLQAVMAQMQQGPSPADEKKIEKLNKEVEALQAQTEAAAEKQQMEKAQALAKQAAAKMAEAMKLQMPGAEKLQDAAREASFNTRAKVSMEVNAESAELSYPGPKTIAVSGAAGGFRERGEKVTPESSPDMDTAGTITAVWGAWKDVTTGAGEDRYVRLRAKLDDKAPYTKIQTVVLKIHAEDVTSDVMLKTAGLPAFRAATGTSSLVKGTE